MLHQRFLSDLRRLSGAATVSVLVVSRDPIRRDTLLLHQGHMQPIPELADTETAIAEASRRNKAATSAAINFYESTIKGGYLLRIAVELDEPDTLTGRFPGGEDRRHSTHGDEPGQTEGAVWFGLRYADGPLPTHLELLRSSAPGTIGDADNWLNRSLIMGAKF